MKRLKQRMAASRFNHGCDILNSRSFDLSLFPSILLTFIGFWLYLIWMISRSICLILFTVAHLEHRAKKPSCNRSQIGSPSSSLSFNISRSGFCFLPNKRMHIDVVILSWRLWKLSCVAINRVSGQQLSLTLQIKRSKMMSIKKDPRSETMHGFQIRRIDLNDDVTKKSHNLS